METPALFASIDFEFPARLAWLAALGVLLWFGWKRRQMAAAWPNNQPGSRRLSIRQLGSLACQLLAFTLLVLALAGAHWRFDNRRQMVIFVTDASRSIGPPPHPEASGFIAESLASRGEHQAKFLAFAEQPVAVTETPPDGATGVAGEAKITGLASDAAAAIRLAAASIDEGYIGKIVLLSDGLLPRADLLNAAASANVPISTVPLAAFPAPEICLRQVLAPAEAARGGDLALQALIAANHAEQGEIEIFRDGQSLAKLPVELTAGEQRLPISVPFGVEDLATLELRLSASSDTIPENNRRRVAVLAKPKTRISLVATGADAADAFAAMLAGQFCDVQRIAVSELADDALADCDLLILADVPTLELSAAATDAIRRFVHDRGGGLIVAGGESTFAEVAYGNTPLENLLPVKAIQPPPDESRVLALVLVIDQSWSMREQDRMTLAKIAAEQAVQVLEPHDKVGIIAFSNDTRWIAEIAPFAEPKKLLEQIKTLEPLGQTHMFSAVERAFLALQQTVADRRHMIVLTDGAPSPGDFDRLAREIAAAGITLSTVTISKDAEQDLMRDMAEIAKGVHLHCEDPNDLPRLLAKETRDVAASEGPAEFTAFPLRDLPGLDVRSAPPLAGYAPTSPKPGSELLLIAAGRDPLLAWWRQGQGLTLAFTAEALGGSSPRWRSWPGYPAFWSRLVRQAARLPDPPSLDVQVARESDRFRVTIEARSPAGANSTLAADYLNDAAVTLAVTGPDGSTPPVVCPQIAPGRYQALVPAEQPGGYFFGIEAASSGSPTLTAMATLFVDYPAELELQPANHELLRLIADSTGGRYSPSPADVFAFDSLTAPDQFSLVPPLVLLALVLFLGEIAFRRLR